MYNPVAKIVPARVAMLIRCVLVTKQILFGAQGLF